MDSDDDNSFVSQGNSSIDDSITLKTGTGDMHDSDDDSLSEDHSIESAEEFGFQDLFEDMEEQRVLQLIQESDEESNSEMENIESSEEEEAASRVVIHYGVTCDECGVASIQGRVFHSTRIIDYDICEECYEENHRNLTLADAFLVFKKMKVHFSEDGIFEDPRSMRVNSEGWPSLAQALNNPKLQNLDVNFNRRWRHAIVQQPTEEGRESIKARLASSTTLKVVYASFPIRGQDVHSEAATAFLDGISASQSIVTLSLTLDLTWDSAVQDLCRLIRNNKSIRFLFVQHWSQRGFVRNLEELQEAESEQDHHVRESAALLFQALGETSIHSFLCRGLFDLGEDCRAAALDALRTRPSLKRIKAHFQVQNDELEQLMDEKKEHWMKDWNDPGASNESRVQVLEEILSCKQVDEQDQVAALFHFVRSNPGSLPELQAAGGSA